MQTRYTEDDLILFIYNELDRDQHEALKAALAEDPGLYHTYCQLLAVTQSLDSIQMEPSETTIDLILRHSQHEHIH